MNEIIKRYEPISLEEMKCVKLMNRIDTKFVTSYQGLVKFLELAQADYYVQMIDGEYNMPYYTHYYDTHECHMYMEHLRGRKRRQKIRLRKYASSGLTFLEIKSKNNKGRTSKKRIDCAQHDSDYCQNFVNEYSYYNHDELKSSLENKFSRITLVNKAKTERLTIDTALRFHNFTTGKMCALSDLVIIELKRDGNVYSPASEFFRQLHIHPAKFSKYCMGMAFSDESLKNNRFKPRMRMVAKMCELITLNEF